MNLGVVTANYPPAVREGGISHYTHIVVRHLLRKYPDITIATGDDYRGKDPQAAVFPGQWNSATVKAIIKEFKARNVEAVNLQYSPAMYPQAFISALGGLLAAFPTAIGFHTLWGGPRVNYMNAIRLLWGARTIIATNSEVLHLLGKRAPCLLKKTCFIPIWANILAEPSPETLSSVKERFGLDDRRFLLHFGMLYPGKGFELLLGSFEQVVKRYGHDCKLVIAGGGISDTQESRNDAKAIVDKLGIGERVVFAGKLPEAEIAALFRLSRAVLLPYESGASDRRGTLMAALAHGKAVITSKPRVPIAYFKSGENMAWPEILSKEMFAETVHEVLEDDSLRERLEQGARAFAAKLSWENIACDMDIALKGLVHA